MADNSLLNIDAAVAIRNIGIPQDLVQQVMQERAAKTLQSFFRRSVYRAKVITNSANVYREDEFPRENSVWVNPPNHPFRYRDIRDRGKPFKMVLNMVKYFVIHRGIDAKFNQAARRARSTTGKRQRKSTVQIVIEKRYKTYGWLPVFKLPLTIR